MVNNIPLPFTCTHAIATLQIFERSLNRIEGLARLLVLERLSDADARTSYLESRRSLRSRPALSGYSRRMANRQRKRKGDLKADEEIAGLEMSDYDSALLHVPYGPGWTAKRIDKLIYQTVRRVCSPAERA